MSAAFPRATKPSEADDQLVRVDRLDQVLVRTDMEAGDAVALVDAFASHEHDRQGLSIHVTKLPAWLVPGGVR